MPKTQTPSAPTGEFQKSPALTKCHIHQSPTRVSQDGYDPGVTSEFHYGNGAIVSATSPTYMPHPLTPPPTTGRKPISHLVSPAQQHRQISPQYSSYPTHRVSKLPEEYHVMTPPPPSAIYYSHPHTHTHLSTSPMILPVAGQTPYSYYTPPATISP